MLKRFEVKGFKNFKETLTIDFTDVRDYKFNTECLTEDTISKMIVYGKNSVGKSNLGLAMFDIVSHLSSNNVTPHLYDYYLNSENTINFASFKYSFQFGSTVIDYEYRKNENLELSYEKLIIDGVTIFVNSENTSDCDFSGVSTITSTLNIEKLDVDSILKYIITNTSLSKDHPLSKMNDYVNHMLWFRSLDENRFIGYRVKPTGYFDFIFEKDTLSEFQLFLQQAGINEKLTVKSTPDGKNVLYFDTATPMPFFKVASSGTKALYTFFYWYKTAKDVSLIFIDEFDAFYHYELAESIVRLLEKMPHTQVILTSHNTNLLTNRIMRPDCYFILSDNKLTSFANATDRELREGHNLEKLYKSGEFDG